MSAPVPARGEAPRLVATLAIAGLLSGLAIVSAYRLTRPRIEANEAAALERAVFQVLPGAVRMERLTWSGSALVAANGSGDLESSIFTGWSGDGDFVGYAIPAAGAGFQDTIKLLYGLDRSGSSMLGMTVLESRETPGLGDRIYKDPHFIAEFHDLVVVPVIELVKGHGEKPNDVDAITGATISSKSVVRILNASCAIWRPRLPPPGEPVPRSGGDQVPRGVERGGPLPGGQGSAP